MPMNEFVVPGRPPKKGYEFTPSVSGTPGDGTATVTTAGTPVQLPNIPVRKVVIQALESNSGTIVVGSSTVVAAVATRRGMALYPTNSVDLNVNNLNLIWIDSTASGDKIHYYYEV